MNRQSRDLHIVIEYEILDFDVLDSSLDKGTIWAGT